jgi:cation diffusion facilitator family transporter
MNRRPLTHFAYLSIAAAVVVIGLKTSAYLLTDSVGLLSDAAESLVNLIAGILALAMLTLAARPPDQDHAYGHSKAEYFSSGVEGTLILIAAVSIAVAACRRLLVPRPLEQVGLGLLISLAASLINFGVAQVMLRVGRTNNSIVLEANANHLLADVWTSSGVILGVAAVSLTGWERLDPLIAVGVAGQIIWTGTKIVRRSILGLMDTALSVEERGVVANVLAKYQHEPVQFHALRTRQAGARRFVSMHVVVPGDWTVHRGHQLLEQLEGEIRSALPNTTVFTHLESLDDPRSWHDIGLDRLEEISSRQGPGPRSESTDRGKNSTRK